MQAELRDIHCSFNVPVTRICATLWLSLLHRQNSVWAGKKSARLGSVEYVPAILTEAKLALVVNQRAHTNVHQDGDLLFCNLQTRQTSHGRVSISGAGYRIDKRLLEAALAHVLWGRVKHLNERVVCESHVRKVAGKWVPSLEEARIWVAIMDSKARLLHSRAVFSITGNSGK